MKENDPSLEYIAMKYDFRKFYIGGEWSLPSCPNDYYVINPATEEAQPELIARSVQ